MQATTRSSTRRAFVKLFGAASSFVMLIKCKTVGSAATLKDAESGTDDFLALSKTLTGFDELDASIASQYLAELRAGHGEGPVQAMIATYKSLELEGGDMELLVQTQILEAQALTPIASAAMMLWYTGIFNKVEAQQPLAIKAYQKAFVWQTIDGKAFGVPGPDTGYWANPPD